MNLEILLSHYFFLWCKCITKFCCAVMPKDDLRITSEFVEVAGSHKLNGDLS